MNDIKLTFSPNDMQILQDALVVMPYRVAARLIDKINTQIQRLYALAVDSRGAMSGATIQDDPLRGD